MITKHIITYGRSLGIIESGINDYDVIDLSDNPDYEFLPNHKYLVVWNDNAKSDNEQPYKIITKKIHLGPRREGHYDISKMDYLVTRSGIIFKFCYLRKEFKTEWITENEYKIFERNIEKIKKKFSNVNLKKVTSKKNGKTYYIFEYAVHGLGKNIDFLLDPNYVKPAPKLEYYKIIRSKEDLYNSFNYFINKPVGSRFGFDYETCHGFPFDSKYFSPMGLGIADVDGIAAYFDIEYIRDHTDYYQDFIQLLTKFLDKHGFNVYTYNVGFELRVTYLLTGKMYPLQDSSAINKIMGDVSYNLTLKYTAMKYCHVSSWDDDFEMMQDLLAEIMNCKEENFGEVRYDSTLPIYTLDDYTECDKWQRMLDMYPGNESEFHRLIHKSWGDPFGAIPSPILGKYCCKDAYHTVLLREASDKLGFSDNCWNCFSANLRLGAQLNINGCFIDRDLQRDMRNQGHTIVAFSSLNLSKWYLNKELQKLTNEELPKSTYIRNSVDIGVYPFDSKSIIRKFMSSSKTGLDEEKMMKVLGFDAYSIIVGVLNDYDKIPVTNGTLRCRSVFNTMNEKLKEYFHYEQFEDSFSIIENNVKYLISNNLDNLIWKSNLLIRLDEVNFMLNQIDVFNPIENVGTIYGEVVKIEQVAEWCKGIFNVLSPQVSEDFLVNTYWDYFDIIQSCYSPDETFKDAFYGKIPMTKFTKKREKLLSNRQSPINSIRGMRCLSLFLRACPEFIPTLEASNKAEAKEVLKSLSGESENKYKAYYYISRYWSYLAEVVKSITCDKDGKFLSKRHQTISELFEEAMWNLVASYDNNVKWALVGLVYEAIDNVGDDDFRNEFFKELPKYDITEKSYKGLALMAYCFRSLKKYSKILGTYIDGMLVDTAIYSSPYDDYAISKERWNHESGGVYKAFPRYGVCSKKSKRWDSNFHTIPSGSECKRIVTTPPGYLMSYFDISGMEVRTLSYLANDEFMLNNYARGVDPYIDLAQLAYPGKDMSYYKKIRSDMKTNLLGSLYGMGVKMMADRTGKTVEEAQELLDIMFSHMKGIKRLIERKAVYPEEHGGDVETILGDKLNISNEPKDRWSRLGNNLCIQGGSAVLMASGFENIIQHSFDDNDIKIRPLNVVHDSAQFYFESDKIFEICQYYTRYMRKYLRDTYGIDYAFDVEVGANYFDMADLSPIDENNLKMKGNYKSIKGIFDKLDSDGVPYRIIKIENHKGIDCLTDGVPNENFKVKTNKNIVDMFYRNGYSAVWDLDFSKYEVIIQKV